MRAALLRAACFSRRWLAYQVTQVLNAFISTAFASRRPNFKKLHSLRSSFLTKLASLEKPAIWCSVRRYSQLAPTDRMDRLK